MSFGSGSKLFSRMFAAFSIILAALLGGRGVQAFRAEGDGVEQLRRELSREKAWARKCSPPPSQGEQQTKRMNSSETPASSLELGEESYLTSQVRWVQSTFGGRACTDEEWDEFTDIFHVTLKAAASTFSDETTSNNRRACADNNILWLYPKEDHNGAFEVDAYVCHRLMLWHEKGCSVKFERITGISEASTIIDRYQDKSITHLVLGGHGSGTSLRWGPDDGKEAMLEAHRSTSEELLQLAARKMQDDGTVFLDSCFASTQQTVENLARYTARVMIRTMRKDPARASPQLTVYGSVHSVSNEEIQVDTQDAMNFNVFNAHGMQSHTAMPQPADDEKLGKKLAAGDWVRTYFFRPDDSMSEETDVGFIKRKTKKGTKKMIEVRFGDDTFQKDIPIKWVRQYAKIGSMVEANIHGDRGPFHAVELLGAADQDGGLHARVKESDGTTRRVLTRKIRPMDIFSSAISGAEYPAPGDWVRVQLETTTKNEKGKKVNALTNSSYGGIVTKLSKTGIKVQLGDKGAAASKKKVHQVEVEIHDVVAVVKPGATVLAYDSESASIELKLRPGLLLSSSEAEEWARVHFRNGTSNSLIDPDWIVSARTDQGMDTFRSTVEGCGCRRLSQSDWMEYGSDGDHCGSDFCCNPNQDSAEWCILEDPVACWKLEEEHAHGTRGEEKKKIQRWGYCKKHTADHEAASVENLKSLEDLPDIDAFPAKRAGTHLKRAADDDDDDDDRSRTSAQQSLLLVPAVVLLVTLTL